MYRPPNQPLQISTQDLKIVFSKLKVEKRPVVICTDHNLDLLKASTHNKMQEFLELASDSGFLCTISKPTRITHQSATLIDNIFISKEFCTGYKSMILIDDISDHMPCLTSLPRIEVDQKGVVEIHKRKLDNKSIDKIKLDMLAIDWPRKLEHL